MDTPAQLNRQPSGRRTQRRVEACAPERGIHAASTRQVEGYLSRAPSRTQKRILVIEDDLRIAGALSIRLRHAGYDVVTAADGLQGLKSAVEVKPDLIVSDIWMPGSVGFLVAERIKAFGLGSIPVIFITANKKKNLARLAKDVGAVEFFEKPYDPEELLAAIARALNPRRARPRLSEPQRATFPRGCRSGSRPRKLSQPKREKNSHS